ncbi:MAG: HlyD family efflux transporter periplasmic adaptor subunit [Leptolyngbya sp. UWPOB_LEPTO1]|uniref:HlyD family secretion protein n=1 Tax=Leptolyngbya sp. UWPOB_LEPTO1 TaxID=2815653 RepID=UPI001ACCA596|nr:HlyD family efflux transporter periplasmic adaptor subunit [Leptolyngbya sp. UWPOB_LEPTO1]MBN8564233.1 HlyD family efflux transporter periplasmic adaptor subunit [Leptolyngbya sp. UWPOB_LEPTO1]
MLISRPKLDLPSLTERTSPITMLRTVTSDEFLPSVSRWMTLSGLVLVGGVAAAIGLAAVTQYNTKVRASAIVRPAGELRIVQSELEGTIRQITVKENQQVKRGDAIAYLDDFQLQNRRNQLQSILQQDRLQIGQLDAQIRALDNQITAEQSAIDRAIAASQAELSRTEREHRDRTITSESEVQEAEAALALATDQMQRFQTLASVGGVSQAQLKEKESAVQSAQARLSRAKAALAPSAAPIQIAQEQIAQQQAKGNSTSAALQKEREAIIQQKVQLQAQLSRQEKEIQQLDRDLQRTVIRATSDGTILKLELRNPGQLVRTGDAIAQISPDSAPLMIRATVLSQEIEQVQIGQRVQLRIAACAYPDYGTLEGTVSEISPDAIVPQNSATPTLTSSTSGGVFTVKVQPKSTTLMKGNQPCSIQAGMEATADIISREETVLRSLLRKARLLLD